MEIFDKGVDALKAVFHCNKGDGITAVLQLTERMLQPNGNQILCKRRMQNSLEQPRQMADRDKFRIRYCLNCQSGIAVFFLYGLQDAGEQLFGLGLYRCAACFASIPLKQFFHQCCRVLRKRFRMTRIFVAEVILYQAGEKRPYFICRFGLIVHPRDMACNRTGAIPIRLLQNFIPQLQADCICAILAHAAIRC